MHHGVADPCADAPTPPDRGRRLWCDNPACVGAVFCERLPSAWAGLRQCRTIAVREHLITWRWTASAADVARVAAHQGLPVSADTVIRARHAEPDPPTDAVHVLVVDEWALRKGRTYATILIDQERHRTVDVLPHDQSGTRRPGSRPIPRSRSGLGTGTRRSPKPLRREPRPPRQWPTGCTSSTTCGTCSNGSFAGTASGPPPFLRWASRTHRGVRQRPRLCPWGLLAWDASRGRPAVALPRTW